MFIGNWLHAPYLDILFEWLRYTKQSKLLRSAHGSFFCSIYLFPDTFLFYSFVKLFCQNPCSTLNWNSIFLSWNIELFWLPCYDYFSDVFIIIKVIWNHSRRVSLGDCSNVHIRIKFEGELNSAWPLWKIFTFVLVSPISYLVISNTLLQRLLVMELLSIYDEKVAEAMGLHWSDEFYEGEFNDLSIFNLYSKETHEPILPCLRNCNSSTSTVQSKQQQDSNVLQVLDLPEVGCEDLRQVPAYLVVNVWIVKACTFIWIRMHI